MHPVQNLEEVVLVDDQNNPIGTLAKSLVHSSHTPLHRGFSVFLFDLQGKVLLQQRSIYKQTWPRMWAGSCCGHPALHESTEQAIRRRVVYELGITEINNLTEILPSFRYRCTRDGIVENEICPVWVGTIYQELNLNPQEVASITWKSWEEVTGAIKESPKLYAEWCALEIAQLTSSPAFTTYLSRLEN